MVDTSWIYATNLPTLTKLGDARCAQSFANARLAIVSDGSEAGRFTVNLLVRLNPQFDIIGTDSAELAALAQAIIPDCQVRANPGAQHVYDAALRVGSCGDVRADWVRQLGSVGWCAHLGSENNTGNVLAQLAVACLGTGSLLAHFFEKEPPDSYTFSLLDYDSANSLVTPESTILGKTTLVGLGGLGSAVLYALRALRVRGGPLRLIEFDILEATNLQRYVLNIWADQSRSKVAVALERLSDLSLMVEPYEYTFRDYFEQVREAERRELFVCALDHRSKRRELQGYIPERIVNASLGLENQVTVSGLGAGRACLNCLYFPDDLDGAHDRAQAQAMGLSVDELHRLRGAGAGVTLAICRARALAAGQVENALDHLEEAPVDTFYRELCGARLLAPTERPQEDVWTALSFQAALGGILQAVEVVKHFDERLADYRLDNSFVWSTFAMPRPTMRSRKASRPDCAICNGDSYLNVYRRRYGRPKQP